MHFYHFSEIKELINIEKFYNFPFTFPYFYSCLESDRLDFLLLYSRLNYTKSFNQKVVKLKKFVFEHIYLYKSRKCVFRGFISFYGVFIYVVAFCKNDVVFYKKILYEQQNISLFKKSIEETRNID